MPRYMDVHSGMKGISQTELLAAHRKDQELENKEGVHYIKAWADPVAGKVFCLADGPSREAVQRVHQHAGHPADEIYEVKLETE